MMDRWGITPQDFEAALGQHESDDRMLHWAESHISGAQADMANSWLSTTKFESLNRQDREESAFD